MKLSKRLHVMLLSLFLVTTLGASTETFLSDGICYSYYDPDGTSLMVVYKDGGYSGDIVIPETATIEIVGDDMVTTQKTLPVVSIGALAFDGCTEIASLTVPASVKSIGENAFRGVGKIGVVEYAEKGMLTSMSYSNDYSNPLSFAELFRITGEGTPSQLELDCDIPQRAFRQCKWLTKVTFLKGVTKIGIAAFRGCTSLTSVEFDDAEVEVIDVDAFNGCNALKDIAIPQTVTKIGLAAFKDCGMLTEMIIPKNVEYLYGETFERCNRLEKVVIESNLIEVLAPRMFSGCSSLADVTLPSSVKTISKSAFEGCSALKQLPGTNVETFAESSFAGCGFQTLEIPKSITYIAKSAFSGCKSLKDIVIPEDSKLENINDFAFKDCSSLTTVYAFKKTAPSASNNSFDNPAQILLVCPEDGVGYDQIPWKEFRTLNIEKKNINYYLEKEGVDSPWRVVEVEVGNPLPEAPVPALDGWQFSGWQLEHGDMEVPNLMPADDLNFYGYFFKDDAKAGDFTYYIQSNDDNAMIMASSDYKNKTEIEIPATMEFEGVIYNVTAVEPGAFAGCTNLLELTIPAGIEEIPERMFDGCTGLMKVNMDGVRRIGASAFANCSALNMERLPQQLETLGELAFCNSGIGEIELPRSITDMGNRVFERCSNLQRVTFENGFLLTTLPLYTFLNCAQLKEVPQLPVSMREIGAGAFSGCSSIRQLVLPEGIATIASSAFSGCSALQYVTLPKSVETIGNLAFDGCSQLEQITINADKCPTAAYATFMEQHYESVPLYVPDADSYKATLPWKKFKTIAANAEFKLTYMLDGAVFGEVQQVKVGTAITPMASPEKDGREFSGWNDEPVVMPANDVEVNGGFKYTLTYVDAADPNSVLCSQELFFGEAVVQPEEALAREGYDYTIDEGVPQTMPAMDMVVKVSYLQTEADITVGELTYHVYTQQGNEHAELIKGSKPNITITSITIPDKIAYGEAHYTVTVIRNDVFKGWIRLESVSLPQTITSIGVQAFANCGSLRTITIPASVETLGDEMFMNCYSMESIVFADNSKLRTLPYSVFQGCTILNAIDLPASLESIGNSAFANCKGLTEIVFPENLSLIGDRAFVGCDKMENLRVTSETMLPEAEMTSFESVTYDLATLHVKDGLQNSLKAPWDKFRNIETAGSGDAPQCAKPLINYRQGVLEFSCATPDAKITSEVVVDDATKIYEPTKVLSQTYRITAYATAPGYKRSDISTATITWCNGTPKVDGFNEIEFQEQTEMGVKGDMNGDNQVTAEDAALILMQLTGKTAETNKNE